MIFRLMLALPLAAALLLPFPDSPAPGCCVAPPKGKPVVNADQTVIILWDAANKIEHFIRKASFKSEADDFGFLVPTPTQPELEESGNDAFPYLLKLTEPEIRYTVLARWCGSGFGCSKRESVGGRDLKSAVKVLVEKEVAGFKAAVLEATSAAALVAWLKENGYAFSPEIEAWAKPYVEQGWKITALKVAKEKDGRDGKSLTAAALRISFKTDRPLFPYREPDPQSPAEALGARSRLLRFYFIADARYQGELTKESPWTGKVAWAGNLSGANRSQTLQSLKLPDNTGPAEWYLTEFEDPWPYKVAPADVYFSRDADQADVRREPVLRYVILPVDLIGLVAILIITLAYRRWWRPRKQPEAAHER